MVSFFDWPSYEDLLLLMLARPSSIEAIYSTHNWQFYVKDVPIRPQV